MKKQKQNLVQMPNELIANDKIKSNTTYLYLMMKLKAQKQNDDSFKLNMYSKKFLETINWTQKTFKKHLQILLEEGVVLKYELLNFEPMQIHIKKIDIFTQIDNKTITKILNNAHNIKTDKNKIKDLTAQAIRLYFYYEKNYNNEYGYAFPSYETISKECKITKNTISYLNKFFKQQKILHIEYGKKTYTTNKNNIARPRKEVNKYTPLCNKRMY